MNDIMHFFCYPEDFDPIEELVSGFEPETSRERVLRATESLGLAVRERSVKSLSGGFTADLFHGRAAAASGEDATLVFKCLHKKSLFQQLCVAPQTVERLYTHAHAIGVGPRVHGLRHSVLVMDRLGGAHPTPADFCPALTKRFARTLHRLHTSGARWAASGGGGGGAADASEPLVWTWIDSMLECVRAQVGADPSTHAAVAEMLAPAAREVRAQRRRLAGARLPLVFAHGNFKPQNVIFEDGDVRLIDFDSSGRNYRGYDLVKFFRRDEPFGPALFDAFLRAYAELCGAEASGGHPPRRVSAADLRREARMCEALTYLEPVVFFLFSAVVHGKDAVGRAQWVGKARTRWDQYVACVEATKENET
jgi:hypothetical protein